MDVSYIKRRLKELKMTYPELSAKSNVPLNTIKSIMSGKTPRPRIDTVRAIETALGLQTATLKLRNIEELPDQEYLPVVGSIACGTPTLAQENITEYLRADVRMHADFILIAKGDSMINARIFDGDVVYIRQQPDVNDGEIAAVQIDDEATLKRVYRYPGKVVLRAENPQYPDIIITRDDDKEVRILGKAVSFQSILR